jgi:hypothetical protein
MPARPRDSRVAGFQAVSVERRLKRNTPVLSRAAGFSAAEVLTLYRIDRASRVALLICSKNPKNQAASAYLLWLRRLLASICRPMVLNKTVLQPKNRTIQSLEWGDDFVREFFVFNDREQLRAVLTALRAPDNLKLPGDSTGHVTSEFAFLLYLYKCSQNAKLSQLAAVFGEDYSIISRALSAFGTWLYDAHSHRLTDSLHFWAQYAHLYASKIRARGLPPDYDRVWGFIDGTLVCTSRPSDVALVTYPNFDHVPVIWDVDAQFQFYCSYAMSHGLKFQGVVGPCGLFMDFTGCAFGSYHDSRLLTESHILPRLLEMHWADLGVRTLPEYFHLMADSAYANGPFMRRVPGGRGRDAVRCAAVRVAVEHAFAKIYQKFPSLDWARNMRVFAGQRIIEMVCAHSNCDI